MATNLHKKEMDQFTSIRSDITPKQRSNNITRYIQLKSKVKIVKLTSRGIDLYKHAKMS